MTLNENGYANDLMAGHPVVWTEPVDLVANTRHYSWCEGPDNPHRRCEIHGERIKYPGYPGKSAGIEWYQLSIDEVEMSSYSEYTEGECAFCESEDPEFDCFECGVTCCAACEGYPSPGGAQLCQYCGLFEE